MHGIDWLVLLAPVVIIALVAAYTQRYTRSVADFMAGGRLAGRYLLCVARSEMGAGAVVFVAMFEVISKAGFVMSWWSWFSVPVALIVSITGFVLYRFRQTRALTLAQFFELRYSKSVRLFTGSMAFVAGIFNFGIIPAVGARFFVSFLQLPQALRVGPWSLPTFVPIMAVLLSLTVFLTLSGGQITVMITDCVEGLISQFAYLILIAALLATFSWPQICEALTNRLPGESLINPFDSSHVKDFNLWYVLMSVFVGVYGTMAWQNQSGYNSAAATPHEARMGGILGRWRDFARSVTVTLLGICAVTYLTHPDFAVQAASVRAAVGQLADPQTMKQMLVPTAVSHMLPIGIKGLFCAIVLMGVFGGDSTHLHSWGGIFVQDIVVPLRKQPFGPKEHIRALRLAIVGVAAFAFLFGSLFKQTEYVVMWFQVTTAMYVGGAGSAIIGGLYWKKGTTAGAWAALVTGAVLSGGGIVVRALVTDFPLNGMQISFFATLAAIAAYVVVSLFTFRGDYDMDRLLHRGVHRTPSDGDAGQPVLQAPRPFQWSKLIGVDDEFTRGDRWIAGGIFAWSMLWFGVCVVGTAWNLVKPWPDSVWLLFWRVQAILLPIAIGVLTTIWFTIGVLRDLRVFFGRLRSAHTDARDDGTVVGHANLDEATASVREEAAP
jgi:SSS family solute:Na+ symporter